MTAAAFRTRSQRALQELPALPDVVPVLPAQVLVTQLEAKKSGYSDVVYLDAKTDT